MAPSSSLPTPAPPPRTSSTPPAASSPWPPLPPWPAWSGQSMMMARTRVGAATGLGGGHVHIIYIYIYYARHTRSTTHLSGLYIIIIYYIIPLVEYMHTYTILLLSTTLDVHECVVLVYLRARSRIFIYALFMQCCDFPTYSDGGGGGGVKLTVQASLSACS